MRLWWVSISLFMELEGELGVVIFKANSQLDEAQRESDQAGQNVYIAGEQMARAKKALKQSRSQLDEAG